MVNTNIYICICYYISMSSFNNITYPILVSYLDDDIYPLFRLRIDEID